MTRIPEEQKCDQNCLVEGEPVTSLGPAQFQVPSNTWRVPQFYLGEEGCPTPKIIEHIYWHYWDKLEIWEGWSCGSRSDSVTWSLCHNHVWESIQEDLQGTRRCMELSASQREGLNQWGTLPATSCLTSNDHRNVLGHDDKRSKSNFARSESLPREMIPLMMSSTFMYCTEKDYFGIPSLTLWPAGRDRFRISCHFSSCANVTININRNRKRKVGWNNLATTLTPLAFTLWQGSWPQVLTSGLRNLKRSVDMECSPSHIS